jgi:hypothetical protein
MFSVVSMTKNKVTPEWRDFEKLIARIESPMALSGAMVTSPDRVRNKVTGRPAPCAGVRPVNCKVAGLPTTDSRQLMYQLATPANRFLRPGTRDVLPRCLITFRPVWNRRHLHFVLLVGAIDLTRVPRPLEGVLDHV